MDTSALQTTSITAPSERVSPLNCEAARTNLALTKTSEITLFSNGLLTATFKLSLGLSPMPGTSGDLQNNPFSERIWSDSDGVTVRSNRRWQLLIDLACMAGFDGVACAHSSKLVARIATGLLQLPSATEPRATERMTDFIPHHIATPTNVSNESAAVSPYGWKGTRGVQGRS